MDGASGENSSFTVVFDLGGVLVRVQSSLSAACRAATLPERVDLGDPRFADVWEALHALHQTGALESEEYFAKMRALVGGAYSEQELRAIHRHWLGEEYEGVTSLIGELHARGVPTGVLSNTNPSHYETLLGPDYSVLRILVERHPERVQASHLLGACKPERAMFHAYTERTGLLPSELVFFDDSPANVQGARREGWRAFLIDPEGDPAAQMRTVLGGLSPPWN